MPVIDSPQYLQLHAALDTFSSLPFAVASQQPISSIFWLDRETLSIALRAVLAELPSADEDVRCRRVREIIEEGWDVFLRVLADGSIVVQAVAVCVIHLTLGQTCSNATLAHRPSPSDPSQAFHLA